MAKARYNAGIQILTPRMDASLRRHDNLNPWHDSDVWFQHRRRLFDKLSVCLVVISLFLAPQSFAFPQSFIDIPFVFASNYSPARSTELRVGAGIGWTQYPHKDGPVMFGYTGLLSFTPLFWQGTRDVYTAGIDHDIEGRANLAYAFDGSNISFSPYGFVAANLGLRLMKMSVYEFTESVIRPDLGIRGGLGVQVCVRDISVKLDSSLGYNLSGINFRTSIIVGFGIF